MTPVGISSGRMALEASRYPAPPTLTAWLRALWSTTGLQPSSIPNPSMTSRFAWLSDFTKLGLASMKCGSSVPLAKAVTDTLSPPTAFTRLARSGTLQQTCSPCACAVSGIDNATREIAIQRFAAYRVFIAGRPFASELVRRVRAEHRTLRLSKRNAHSSLGGAPRNRSYTGS